MKKMLYFMLLILTSSCKSTPVETVAVNNAEANEPISTPIPYTMSEVEALAGFDVKEPAYLPVNVSFDYATYESSPNQNVTLYFNFGDRGKFFQIVQTPIGEAIPNPNACGVAGDECEVIQIGAVTVNYHLTPPTESLLWDADGFSFQLFRTAGEPDKLYKDELIKVVESMR